MRGNLENRMEDGDLIATMSLKERASFRGRGISGERVAVDGSLCVFNSVSRSVMSIEHFTSCLDERRSERKRASILGRVLIVLSFCLSLSLCVCSMANGCQSPLVSSSSPPPNTA